MLQAIAAGWHHKSASQLIELADAIGRERIQVVHGTIDPLITIPHGEVLITELGGEDKGITRIILDNASHGLIWERRADINNTISRLIEKTEAMV